MTSPLPAATPAEYVVAAGTPRLDQFLAAQPEAPSRARIQKLVAEGAATVNGRPAKASQRLEPGAVVRVQWPDETPAPPVARELPLNVVYEDDSLLVVDKPAGLVVHPALGHADDTLVNALLAERELPESSAAERPGIVHRLDKDTSGLLVVAKTPTALTQLSEQLQRHEVEKTYLALVHGQPAPRGTIEAPIGRDPRHRQRMAVVREGEGKEAITHFRVLRRGPRHSLLEVDLVTGRTHQIRVHLAAIGHPVVGDLVYGHADRRLERQFLHASGLAFRHPRTGKRLSFTSPLPPDLAEALDYYCPDDTIEDVKLPPLSRARERGRG